VFGEAFKYDDGAKFRDYVGATTRKTLFRIPKFCAVLYICRVFNFVLNNVRKVRGLLIYKIYCFNYFDVNNSAQYLFIFYTDIRTLFDFWFSGLFHRRLALM
jgi:hypothetical protein